LRPLAILFPYTTLFRSLHPVVVGVRHVKIAGAIHCEASRIREIDLAQGVAVGGNHGPVPLGISLLEPTMGGVLICDIEAARRIRSEEHTSELQSPYDLV